MSQNYGQHHVYEADREPDAPGEVFVYIEQFRPLTWVRMPLEDFLAMVADYAPDVTALNQHKPPAD